MSQWGLYQILLRVASADWGNPKPILCKAWTTSTVSNLAINSPTGSVAPSNLSLPVSPILGGEKVFEKAEASRFLTFLTSSVSPLPSLVWSGI